jgi:4'-phosphopantetheinyl transferase
MIPSAPLSAPLVELSLFTPPVDPRCLAGARASMSPEEVERESRFLHAEDRRIYTFTRALVRLLLSSKTGLQPTSWRFTKNEFGRPEVCEPEPARELRFNVSHTRRMIAIATAWHSDIGIDIESTNREIPWEASRLILSAAEELDIRRRPPHGRRRRFFQYWTLKEAYLKALGVGLTVPLDLVTFSIPTSCSSCGPGSLVSFDQPALPGWSFYTAELPTEHQLSIATRSTRGQARLRLTTLPGSWSELLDQLAPHHALAQSFTPPRECP